MSILPKNPHGCPFLFLAPMEGIGDRCFRMAMASIGGFDMAVRDFLRVPSNAHVKSLAVQYIADEIAPIPLVAQLMGSDPELMAAMAVEMQERGAPRIDINCGCPSNTVTGRGAGSSLLREPNFLHQVAKAVVEAVSIPVSLKMRSGYENTSLFKENLLAAQESGVCYITLHPRTKVDGYGPPARWDLIAEAKSILSIPLVGNGDILSVDNAIEMLRITRCDALMIGRGCIINPFLFQQIKAHFSNEPYTPLWSDVVRYFHTFLSAIPSGMPIKSKISKMKQLFGFLFKGNEKLLSNRNAILTSSYTDLDAFIDFGMSLLQQEGGFQKI